MNQNDIWIVIAALAIGSYLLRFSFLGLIGNREMPAWLLRHLRYTAVAFLPAVVAPLVVWSGPTSQLDVPQIIAGLATLVAGYLSRNTFVAILAGILTLTGFILLG